MLASCFVHPMDVVKNRMQMQGEGTRTRQYKSSLHVLGAVLRNEGVAAAYAGLSAGLLRQATYATTRLGMYTLLFEKFTTVSKEGKRTPPSFSEKIVIASIAGSCGAVVGTPAEVALVRMTTDGRLPAELRRNYRNVFHAIYRVSKEEGMTGVFRGCGPTVIRAIVTNIAQLASYSQAKEFILSTGYFGDNLAAHFCAGMLSGFITAFASLPVDIAKTRVQNMKIIDGKPEYRGMLDVVTRVIKNEGIASLWKGFTPYYFRIGPHTVLTLIFLEQINGIYSKYVLGKDKVSGL